MSFQIVIDTACDVPDRVLKENNIGLVSTTLLLNNGTEIYKDFELEYAEFIRRLKNKEYAKTSQPTPAEFKAIYDEYSKNGEPILSIHITSKLSGTMSNANAVAQDYENIFTFDTQTVSIGSGYLVELAVFLRDLGKSIYETIIILEKARDDLHIEVLIEDISYLKRGGRINFSKYAILALFRLKPLIHVADGILVSAGFGISHRGAMNTIVKRVRKYKSDKSLNYRIGYSTNISDAQYLVEKIPEINEENSKITSISTTLIAHTGPDAVGILIAPEFNSYLEI